MLIRSSAGERSTRRSRPLVFGWVFPPYILPMRLLTILMLLSWVISGTHAIGAIPKAYHPPQLAQLTPPVYPQEYARLELRQAFSVGVHINRQGELTRTETASLPESLVRPVEESMSRSAFRVARQAPDQPVDGYQRILIKAYFTPVSGSPTPTPVLHFDEAARDKMDSIARTIVRGWLRIRLTINARGEIQRIETQNRGLDAALNTFFQVDIDTRNPPFEPAIEGGRAVSGQIDLFWDLTPQQDRKDFEDAATELVTMGANPLSGEVDRMEEVQSYQAWVFPHRSNRVIGAFADPDMPVALSEAFLERAARWFIPDRNVSTPLEVSLRYHPDDHSLHVLSFRPVEITGPSLRHSARPEYPRRRLLPNPEGFVRVAMTVGRDGRPANVEVLEVSSERFRSPALEALEYWHFTPMQIDGKAVSSRLFWTIRLDPTTR